MLDEMLDWFAHLQNFENLKTEEKIVLDDVGWSLFAIKHFIQHFRQDQKRSLIRLFSERMNGTMKIFKRLIVGWKKPHKPKILLHPTLSFSSNISSNMEEWCWMKCRTGFAPAFRFVSAISDQYNKIIRYKKGPIFLLSDPIRTKVFVHFFLLRLFFTNEIF